jgi:hypothetical protein
MSFSDRSGKEVYGMEGLIDDLSWGFELHETFSLKQGITFKLSNAGHILGSCFIRFEIPNDTSETQNSKLKTAFPLFSQETSDARIHPFYPTRTHPAPVISLFWNPPMAIEIIPTEKTELTLWKNRSIKPLQTKALFTFPHFPLEEPRS